MSQKPVPFRIFKITNDPIELHADLMHEKEAVAFSTEFSFNGNLEQGVIGCRSVYVFSQNETVISSLTVYCYFEIEKDYLRENVQEMAVTIDKDFLRYLATISVGTARGIQHAKTQGTILNQWVIPPINLMEFDFQDYVLR
jgi:hypothetical protein